MIAPMLAMEATPHVERTTSDDELILQFSTASSGLSNWASALIRRINHSPFSHVDIVLPAGPEWPKMSCLGASDQGITSTVIKGNPQGVAIRPFDYQEFGYRRQMIIKTPLAGNIVARALTQLGKPFDHESLKEFISDQFPDPSKVQWRDPSAWFCAEYVCWSEETENMWGGPLQWPKTRVSPTDLLLLHLGDPRWANPTTFWRPIDGLIMGKHER